MKNNSTTFLWQLFHFSSTRCELINLEFESQCLCYCVSLLKLIFDSCQVFIWWKDLILENNNNNNFCYCWLDCCFVSTMLMLQGNVSFSGFCGKKGNMGLLFFFKCMRNRITWHACNELSEHKKFWEKAACAIRNGMNGMKHQSLHLLDDNVQSRLILIRCR